MRWKESFFAVLLSLSGLCLASLDLAELESAFYDVQIIETPRLYDEDVVSAENVLTMTNKHGQNFVCQLPEREIVLTKAEDSSVNPKVAADILAANLKECIKHKNGWWTYTVCRGQHLLQEHGTAKDTDFISNSLGIFSGRMYLPTDFSKSTKDRELYLEEKYDMGTLCEIAGSEGQKRPRAAKVRYSCDVRLHVDEAVVWLVEEVETCQYLVTVKVGSLCALPQFVPPRDQELSRSIECQPVISQEAKQKMEEKRRRMAENKERAEKRQKEIREEMERMQTRRWSIERRRLERDGEKYAAKMGNLDDDFVELTKENLKMGVLAKTGEDPTGETLEAIETIVDSMTEIRTPQIDYPSIAAEDRANVWFYFNDPKWREDGFPQTLDQVDVLNGFYDTMLDAIEEEKLEEHSQFERNIAAYRNLAMNHAPGDYETLHVIFEPEQMRDELLPRFGPWLPVDKRTMTAAIFAASRDEDFVREIVANFRKVNQQRLQTGVSRENIKDMLHMAPYSLAQAQAVGKLFYNLPVLVRTKYPKYGQEMAEIVDRLVVAWEQLDAEWKMGHPEYPATIDAKIMKLAERAGGDPEKYYELKERERDPIEREQTIRKYHEEVERFTAKAMRDAIRPQWPIIRARLISRRRQALAEMREKDEDVLKGMAAAVFTDAVDAEYLLRLLSNVGVTSENIKLKVQTTDGLKTSAADIKQSMEVVKLSPRQAAIIEEIVAKQLSDMKEREKGRQRAAAYQYIYKEENGKSEL